MSVSVSVSEAAGLLYRQRLGTGLHTVMVRTRYLLDRDASGEGPWPLP